MGLIYISSLFKGHFSYLFILENISSIPIDFAQNQYYNNVRIKDMSSFLYFIAS